MYLLTTLVVFVLGRVERTIAGSTCEPIKIPLCEKHLPYNMTMFPNALEQLSQHHARQKIDLFRAIVAINCSKEAGFFLCSYHLPICAPEFKSKPIRPCRSVCKKVMADCLATIRRYKREWPEDVVCEDLPSYETDVCVTPSSFVKSGMKNYPFLSVIIILIAICCNLFAWILQFTLSICRNAFSYDHIFFGFAVAHKF